MILNITARIRPIELLALLSSIHEIALPVVDHLVFSFPAIRYGECHYRAIEHDQITELKTALH